MLFTEKSEKPVAIDFRTDQPFTLRSLQIFPARQPIQTNARLLVKENGGYRMLSEFKIDRFNANLNVGFDPYAPVVISVPETTASEFRLELANTGIWYGIGRGGILVPSCCGTLSRKDISQDVSDSASLLA